jgi:murein DD-endopeptidase MepM/ murein hydrolase activator NlpD
VVSASSGDSAITGVSGYFTITNLIIGTYTITPTKSGYTFSPASRTITVPPDATGQDFIGNAGDVTIDPATRTVENSVIKIRWDLTNAERVQALYFKPFNTSQNLGGSHAVEFIGNASAFDPTNGCTPVNVLVADRNTNSSWQGVSDGQTANVEIASISEQDYPVTTRFVITANSPVIRVERTFGFGSKSLSSSNLQTYALRGYNRNNFYRYAWQRVDGSVETSEEVCECACTPSNWGQTWIDLEAPAWNVGLALINLPSNPTSMPWLDKDIWSQTAYISAMVPRVTGGFSQDLTVSYLIVPHLGDYTALGGFYFVSGRVTNDGNTPISGVVVSASSGSSGITNADGHYTITNLLTGTYTITPTLDGYRFAPITRTVTVPPSKTEQNFIIRPAIPTPFLNPPIANSTVADALRGSTNGGGTGRVNAWFDHSKPIYTRDTDNLVRNYVGTPVPESCNLGGAGCYNGHSGTDFNKAAGIKDNPILAAAAGVVTGVVRTDNGGYGVQLWIDHENGYATLYGHLKANSIPVTLTNGTRVNAGQQIGIMGNTGRVVRLKGDGTHLHFGVYYDVDGDRRWTEFQEPNEVVDPFGWMDFPNQPSPPDPWSVPSFYLWIHQIYSQTVAGSSGITLSSPSGTANVVVPIGALTSTVTLQLMDAPPVAEASAQLRSTGRSFWLRVLEWLYGGSGNGLASIAPPGFAQPVTVTVAYSDTETLHLNESQLTIYRWNESGNAWTALATTVDVAQNKAVAQSAEVGNFDLQAPLLCPADVWEPNDNYYAASLLTPNSAPESQLFDIEQDEDWLRLDAVAGGKYVIWTGNLAAAVDTTLQMYDTDGLTLLDSDDNSGGGNASRLEWYAPASGTYFVRVIRAPGSTYGCSASYSISATQELRLYLPRILKNVAY